MRLRAVRNTKKASSSSSWLTWSKIMAGSDLHLLPLRSVTFGLFCRGLCRVTPPHAHVHKQQNAQTRAHTHATVDHDTSWHLYWVITKLKGRVTESESKTSTATERLSRTFFRDVHVNTLGSEPSPFLFDCCVNWFRCARPSSCVSC